MYLRAQQCDHYGIILAARVRCDIIILWEGSGYELQQNIVCLMLTVDGCDVDFYELSEKAAGVEVDVEDQWPDTQMKTDCRNKKNICFFLFKTFDSNNLMHLQG